MSYLVNWVHMQLNELDSLFHVKQFTNINVLKVLSDTTYECDDEAATGLL